MWYEEKYLRIQNPSNHKIKGLHKQKGRSGSTQQMAASSSIMHDVTNWAHEHDSEFSVFQWSSQALDVKFSIKHIEFYKRTSSIQPVLKQGWLGWPLWQYAALEHSVLMVRWLGTFFVSFPHGGKRQTTETKTKENWQHFRGLFSQV